MSLTVSPQGSTGIAKGQTSAASRQGATLNLQIFDCVLEIAPRNYLCS
jgi:hypothetical protein